MIPILLKLLWKKWKWLQPTCTALFAHPTPSSLTLMRVEKNWIAPEKIWSCWKWLVSCLPHWEGAQTTWPKMFVVCGHNLYIYLFDQKLQFYIAHAHLNWQFEYPSPELGNICFNFNLGMFTENFASPFLPNPAPLQIWICNLFPLKQLRNASLLIFELLRVE
jgi:hypothetical protein